VGLWGYEIPHLPGCQIPDTGYRRWSGRVTLLVSARPSPRGAPRGCQVRALCGPDGRVRWSATGRTTLHLARPPVAPTRASSGWGSSFFVLRSSVVGGSRIEGLRCKIELNGTTTGDRPIRLYARPRAKPRRARPGWHAPHRPGHRPPGPASRGPTAVPPRADTDHRSEP